MNNVLVLGGTGTTGRKIVAKLRALGVGARAAARTTGDIRFDWADRTTHAEALAGVSAVYLLPPIGDAEPARVVEPFVLDALDAGVRRIVLLSSSAVTDDTHGLGALPSLVRAAPEWAVLRPSWFMQNFLGDHPIAHGVAKGEIVTATGEGRIAFIDATDIAAVAVHALIDPEPHNAEHLLTGPQALTYADAAAVISAHSGRRIRHQPVSTAEFCRHLIDTGLSAEFAEVLAAMDEHLSRGAEDRVTTTVERITGRPSRSFPMFIADEMPAAHHQ